MAEIFQIFGTIAVKNDEANKALDETGKKAQKYATDMNTAQEKAGRAMDETGKKAKKLAADVKSAFEKIGKIGTTVEKGMKTVARAGLGIATAFGASAVAIGKSALDVRSSIEQGVGGAAAVFGNYAKQITSAAQGAYKVAGLSMAEYLETANKMGALFKGSGFDVQESADMTSQAMQRAADVASIMGIDVKSAMESVAGAAKGNFTMMDNLGVSMNDTTLETYRLEKGMDKAVSKMTTSEKVGLAMRMFLERTTYAAGNYAKENDTVAGSLQTLKGAWSNFLGGVGSFKDVQDSAFGFLVNAADSLGLSSFTPALKRVRTFVGNIADILSMDDLSGREKFRKIESRISVRAYKLFKNLGRKLPGMLSDIGDEIARTIGNFNNTAPMWLDVGNKIFQAVRGSVRKAAEQLKNTAGIIAPSVISGWFTFKMDALGIGIDILTAVADSITEDAAKDDSTIKTAMGEAIKTVITAAVKAIPSLLDAGLSLVTTLGDAVSENSDLIVNGISSIINSVILFFANPDNLEGIVKAGGQIVAALGQGIAQSVFTLPLGIVDAVFGTDVRSEAQDFLTTLNDKTKEYNQYVESLGLAPKKGGVNGLVKGALETQDKMSQSGQTFLGMLNTISSKDGMTAATENVGSLNASIETTGEKAENASEKVSDLKDELDTLPSKKTVEIQVRQLIESAKKIVGGVTGGGKNSYIMDTAYDTGTLLRVKPNADGAVFSKPTIFNTRLGYQMVGEAGKEAVAPISVLQSYVNEAVKSANADRDGILADLTSAIRELREEMNMNMSLYINKKKVASAMSRDMGRSIGNREYALMRGMGG